MNLVKYPKHCILFIVIALIIGIPLILIVYHFGIKYHFYIGTIYISLIDMGISYFITSAIVKRRGLK